MRKIYDMTVKVRTYQDRNGNEKSEWMNIGSVLENDRGMFAYLKPHINLAGLPRRDDGDVMVSFFEPKPREGGQRRTYDDNPAGGGYGSALDDDIPFAPCWEV